MAKTNREDLLDAVADDFHTYLRKDARFGRVIGAAHPELDINDIETLLRVHFVLTDARGDAGEVGVLDFMEKLEERIRKMKTSTRREPVELRGKVRGHIDWQQTLKTRARAGRFAEPIFVCNHPEEHYDIDENLVLKKLLSVIYGIISEDLEPVISNPEEYEWLDIWTDSATNGTARSTESATELLRRIYERNVYLQRIDVDDDELTERTIESVKNSRSAFYQEAAILLDRFRQLMNHQLQSDEAREILNNTLIAPEKTEALFELYWIFRILNAYDDVNYHVLTEWSDPTTIATWTEDESRFVLSHDATGEGLTFDESLEGETGDSDGYLYRMNEVLNQWQNLSEKLLDHSGQDSLWGGRPDIVLEEYSEEDGSLDQVFLGEVKYSRDIGYIATGLRQLLEYMAFVRSDSDGEYVEETESVLDSDSVKGLLFVDILNRDTTSPDDIEIVQYGDTISRVL